MFLNEIGQPFILQKGVKYNSYEEHRGALLISSAAYKDHVVPENWSGCVIGSEQDILRLKFQGEGNNYSEKCKYIYIRPNEPTQIDNNGTVITITLIPAGKNKNELESILYYIENGLTRYVIVDRLSGYLDFLPKAHDFFRNGLGLGIDVLYIDEETLDENDLNEDIYSLVHLIKPKFIYGLRGGKLPKWLQDLRRIQDIYKI
ncbi:uncharacterized protein LOC108093292 [Drosophila ficusphila]|uniref:uncharacterized protein LOC108093292 n=1 Tax=Drosophila ficusphila TaxID=30025 RepID=UPI0007E7F915|nr:uncharacterized protein LOC108093292 [Drosophila ficusphila]